MGAVYQRAEIVQFMTPVIIITGTANASYSVFGLLGGEAISKLQIGKGTSLGRRRH
jgi:hypothetical protein